MNTPGSEGCQTIYADQWDAFITMATSEAKRLFGDRWKQTVFPYILFDNDGTIS